MKWFIATVFLFFYFKVKPQIVVGDTISANVHYTNFPDVTLYVPLSDCRDSIDYLDVNLDGTNDLEFDFYGCAGSGSFNEFQDRVYIINPNIQVAVLSNNITWVDTMSVDSLIYNNKTWDYSSAAFILRTWFATSSGSSTNGIFSGSNKYLGFRSIVSTDTLYGWVMLNAGYSIVIKSMAFQTNLNGINEIKSRSTEIKIYPNPANSILQISFSGSQTDEIKIIDLLGNEVMNDKIKKGSTQIDISSLSNGVYFIRVGSNTQKFVKQ